MQLEFFRTARLLVRPFQPSDAADLARLAGDPEVARYVGDGQPLDTAAVALWIARSRGNVRRFGYGTGAVVEQASGRLVGWTGFARPDGEPEEVIYGFDKAVWGRGYASETLSGLIRFAFRELRLPELRATVHPDNLASQHVLRKAGFAAAVHGEDLLFTLARPDGFDAAGD